MIVISILATFMLTHLLTEKDGPEDIFWKLRQRLEALNCFTCTSVWVAALVAVYPADGLYEWLIYLLGLAGGAVLIDWLLKRFPDE